MVYTSVPTLRFFEDANLKPPEGWKDFTSAMFEAIKRAQLDVLDLLDAVHKGPEVTEAACAKVDQHVSLIITASRQYMSLAKKVLPPVRPKKGEKAAMMCYELVRRLAESLEAMAVALFRAAVVASRNTGDLTQLEQKLFLFRGHLVTLCNALVDADEELTQAEMAARLPVISLEEANGIDLKRKKKDLVFVLQLAKRVAAYIEALERALRSGCDRENRAELHSFNNCVQQTVHVARRFAKARHSYALKQVLLGMASSLRLSGSLLHRSIEEVLDKRAEPSSLELPAQQCADVLSTLLDQMLQAHRQAVEGTHEEEVRVWDEETLMDSNIEINSDQEVTAGTLNQLVVKLTSPTSTNMRFNKAFITTYQSFCTPTQLFDKMIERYDVPRTKFTDMRAAVWKKTIVVPIQLRVYNVFKLWLDIRFPDFTYELVKRLNDFMDARMRRDGHHQLADVLTSRLRRKITALESNIRADSSLQKNINPHEYLLTLTPRQLAEQLSLFEMDIYRQIQPIELLNLAWSKDKLKHRAPNVTQMVNNFNLLSGWVATVILDSPGLKNRGRIYEKMINLGKALRACNNFNTLLAVIAGVNSAAVRRLKWTKERQSKAQIAAYEELQATMSSDQNYSAQREVIKTSDPPLLPYLGVYLTDLTFIEDGNNDMTKTGLINFNKRRLVYQVLVQIEQYQQVIYDFTPDPVALACLQRVQPKDNDALYALSLEREPRGKDKADIQQ
eukprot:CAMPEP_0177640058 /NCGR_PEP_ID=MMETSP0447-20121125/6346_1 /TAXON_ID=0 /ORGANISM="Stygamoeba regulata, Strain BSH-02190019" /LENGTH=729 /DNA_ID=CAMNT_0019142115 /DNA_START=140 /DNA_END=2329 /DNA_ORIENTATION=+